MAEEALRLEKARGKKFDYWVFVDDDLDITCADEETEGMKEVLGDGSCWKKVINFVRSGQVPDNASSITLPVGITGKYVNVYFGGSLWRFQERTNSISFTIRNSRRWC